MIELSFHIGVEEAHIAFPSAPENIIFTIQGNVASMAFFTCVPAQLLRQNQIGRGTVHIAGLEKTFAVAP